MSSLREALRSLLRRPASTILAAVTLAVGIGSATAIFSVVYALLLKPVAFPEAERLVRVWELTPERDRFSSSGPNYLDFAASTTSFDAMAAFGQARPSVILTPDGDPARIEAVPVTASFFDVVGIRPARGRAFLPSEDRMGAESQRVILGHALWRGRFAGDPSIVNRGITLDRRPYIVTGVMPAGFDFPEGADAWVPAVPRSPSMSEGKALGVIARLKAGVSIEHARADLEGAAAVTSARDPNANAGWGVDVEPFRDWLVSDRIQQSVLVLSAAIGCLLLLACANVANLRMAQASRRHAELRLRAALGASRAQLVRLLFAESAMLAAAGAALGLLMAMWMLAALRAIGAGRVPRLDEIALHAPVLVFTAAIAAGSCILFGIAPALHASRLDLRSSLDAGHRFSRRGRRGRGLIVAVEVALAVPLLTGAGLLAVSFSRLANVHPGFETANLLAAPVDMIAPGDDEAAPFFTALIERARALPGVEVAAATSTNPFRQVGFSNSVTPEEAVAFAPPSGLVEAGWRSVTPGYFAAAGVPVVAGRTFSSRDTADGERVVIVSQSLASRLWPEATAVGRRILWGGLTGRPRTVVGVSGDIRDVSPDADAVPMLFVPHAQVPLPSMTLLVRGQTPARLAPLLRAELRARDPALAAAPMSAVDDNRSRAFAGPRFNAWLLAAFAIVATTLAASGVYAMLAFAVAERRREIAVRLALGANPAVIVRMVLGEGMRLTAAGLAAGLVIAAWLTRYLGSLLFDVRPRDPATFAFVAVALVGLTLAASLLPARQASRVDPREGMRVD